MITEINSAVRNGNIFYTGHADDEMTKDNLTAKNVETAILNGKIIENYPNDKPLPSCLISGKSEEISIHVVVGYNKEMNRVRVITVYIPSIEKFTDNYSKRRK